MKLENKCTGEAATICISMTHAEYLFKFPLGKWKEPEILIITLLIWNLQWCNLDRVFGAVENDLPNKFR